MDEKWWKENWPNQNKYTKRVARAAWEAAMKCANERIEELEQENERLSMEIKEIAERAARIASKHLCKWPECDCQHVIALEIAQQVLENQSI